LPKTRICRARLSSPPFPALQTGPLPMPHGAANSLRLSQGRPREMVSQPLLLRAMLQAC
jgi:hypothetical protein